MQIFEFAVVYHPEKGEKKSDDGKSQRRSEIIVKPTTVLAKDQAAATLLAAREIPAEYVDKLDRVEVAVRPF